MRSETVRVFASTLSRRNEQPAAGCHVERWEKITFACNKFSLNHSDVRFCVPECFSIVCHYKREELFEDLSNVCLCFGVLVKSQSTVSKCGNV